MKRFIKPSNLATKYPKLFNWQPEDHGLSKGFAMTNFTELKGCGCKVPQTQLLKYLGQIGSGDIGKETPDVSVFPVKQTKDFHTISTIDYFYPLVANPYAQGRIACCNVLSDLYAMGVTQVDTMLMVLGVCTKMTEEEKQISTSLMLEGFNDCAKEAKTSVTGGQSVQSPWPQIGGVGIASNHKDDFIMPNGAEAGDYLVLTKPLGVQLAVNTYQWMTTIPQKWDAIKGLTNEKEINEAFDHATKSMCTLNAAAASLFKKHKIKASTDVTGFGILGHAKYLAKAQKRKVQFVIDNLPIIRNLYKLDKKARDFRFLEGFAAETSGGLLLATKDPDSFLRDYKKLIGEWGWVIGRVEKSQERDAIISKDVKIQEI
ncbi:unnamed protein product [Paramecium primaurelia]|uniref:Selenide, water dikinase n=1 Tax=Paramecium primaurelia TaxID=5886 RepID=A0A8S1LVL1_PARPR|nr:unnamed protein product [Paramecium primaurelia]